MVYRPRYFNCRRAFICGEGEEVVAGGEASQPCRGRVLPAQETPREGPGPALPRVPHAVTACARGGAAPIPGPFSPLAASALLLKSHHGKGVLVYVSVTRDETGAVILAILVRFSTVSHFQGLGGSRRGQCTKVSLKSPSLSPNPTDVGDSPDIFTGRK